MEEELISFETAKLAKEKGFNIKTLFAYNLLGVTNNSFKIYRGKDFDEFSNTFCFTPTQSLLQKWLREKYFLHIVLIPTITGDMTYKIVDIQCDPQYEIERPPYNDVCAYDFITYEEALENGLQEALKLV